MRRSLSFILLASIALPGLALGFEYTNGNVGMVYHEAPAEFAVSADGEAYGRTVSGIAFSQTNVTTNSAVRLQRFSIGSAFWYVSDHGVIWATSDLEALSIYLSLA